MFMRKTMGLFGGMAFALAAAGATRTYTSAQTVSDVLTGDDDVVVDCVRRLLHGNAARQRPA